MGSEMCIRDSLKTISHEELRTKAPEDECGPELHQLYMSLLGGVAFLYLTRADALVFISACQRYAHKPCIIHVKRLNVIVRWIQRNPKKLTYTKLGDDSCHHFRLVSDAAFKKEETKGHALRGSLYLICPGSGSGSYHSDAPCHMIEYMSKALRHVTRSTFSSELLAACDTIDLGLLIVSLLHELKAGPSSATNMRKLREEGGYSIPMCLSIDAMSVFASITSLYVKAPAEKGLLAHLQYVRELLDTGVIDALMWIDTRDMHSDGLTKGAVERDLIQSLMDGHMEFKHEIKLWQPKVLRKDQKAAIMDHLKDMENTNA